MAIHRRLAILRVEDLPGVREAMEFRRRCGDAAARVKGPRQGELLCDRARSFAMAVVASACDAWRSGSWPAARERLSACEKARASAMRALYELYAAGDIPGDEFDRAAKAGSRLREALTWV